jgi:hypothetical protein
MVPNPKPEPALVNFCRTVILQAIVIGLVIVAAGVAALVQLIIA